MVLCNLTLVHIGYAVYFVLYHIVRYHNGLVPSLFHGHTHLFAETGIGLLSQRSYLYGFRSFRFMLFLILFGKRSLPSIDHENTRPDDFGLLHPVQRSYPNCTFIVI